jgi:hypothetical protein
MIFGDKYVFLELPRTGSTYARYILMGIPNSHGVGKKHNVYNTLSAKEKIEFDSKYKIGTVRNPFEYYVSQFAFCCEKRGGLYERITTKPDIFNYYNYWDIFTTIRLQFKYKKDWLKLFSDPNSNKNFKQFMKMLIEIHPEAIGNHYGLSGLNKSIGLLTFEYLKLFSPDFIKESKSLDSYDKLVNYDRDNNFMDCILRNEKLRDDLLKNYKYYADSEEIVEKAISNRPKRSKTATKKKPAHLFYDEELKNFVYEKDKFIFDKYGYTFEDIIK